MLIGEEPTEDNLISVRKFKPDISREMEALFKVSTNEQPELRAGIDELKEYIRWCGFYTVPSQLPDWLL